MGDRREDPGADAWIRRILTGGRAPDPDADADAAPDPNAPWPSADQGNLGGPVDYRDAGREAEQARTALEDASAAFAEAVRAAKREGAAQQAEVDRIGLGPKPPPQPPPPPTPRR